jgi:hypothetical protein
MFDRPIVANDVCTILGTVVSITGQGSNAVVVIQPTFQFPSATFTSVASDSNGPATNGPALSADHQQYSVGDATSTPAYVLSVASGTGNIAILSLQLNSGAVVQVPSGACVTPNNQGITAGSI